ncbi:S-adenosylmethionine-binding protein [Youhaiella tibetensis]|nr:MT-A70 family methyltransferase [Youhaiella tibetensis]GGF38498.1 S-adenosylmethionine-binding protein [Youhaiella tibetensis]
MSLPYHQYANLFPLIEGREFSELVADIRENGLLDPIVMLDGRILDGRNRFRAMLTAGLLSDDDLNSARKGFSNRTFRQFVPETQGDPLTWVLSKNLRRRHLTPGQLGMLGADIATMRQGERTDRKPDLPAIEGRSEPSQPVSQAQAAQIVGTPVANVERAQAVKKSGAPELVESVRKGDVAVSAALEIAKLPVTEQLNVLRTADPRALARIAKERRQEVQEGKRARREERERELAEKVMALPDRKYVVILADPEWQFRVYSQASGMDRAADNHYPTSPTDEIAARDVRSIAAEDSVLLLWATVPMLLDAIRVMEAWGFAYKTHWIWLKDQLGTGFWNRNQHELLLLGVRGAPPAPAMGDQFRSALAHPVGAHSEKPPFAHEIAERYFPNVPKIELNARQARPGWAAWGLEAPLETPVADIPSSAPHGEGFPSSLPDPSQAKASTGNGATEAAAAIEEPLDSVAGEASRASVGAGTDASAFKSTPATDAVIKAAYGVGAVDLSALAGQLGATKLQVRRRANQLGLSSRERQRAAVTESNKRRSKTGGAQ